MKYPQTAKTSPGTAYLGTLPPSSPFPTAFTPNGEIVRKELDELDVEHLISYRIRR